MKYILALTLLFLPLPVVANDDPNYCLDPEANQQWARMFMDSPDDDALRLGLCQLVEKELITLQRATDLFEIERVEVVRKRAVEELQRKAMENQGT